MAGYYAQVVAGDGGGRASSGLIRRKIAAATDEADDDDCGFLELSLGSIYNNKPSPSEDHAFSQVVAGFYPPPPPAFALGLGTTSPAAAAPVTTADGGHVGTGHVVLPANANALPVAVAVHGHHQAPPPPALSFARGGIGIAAVPVPVPVPVPAPQSKGAAVAPLLGGPAPPPSPANRKSCPRARGRRSNAAAAAGRHRSSVADADAAPPSNGAEQNAPPFPWATKIAGAHPTLAELFEQGIVSVSGEVRCKRCDATTTISYDISSKFNALSTFILANVESMHDRAPAEWMSPALGDCGECGQKGSLRPVIAAEKGKINWMFLLLGQTLGLCTLDQLKHFCERTRQHRTGAKDRVLYSTYMELCNQLCPGGPFDMASERKNRIRAFAA